MRTLKDLESMKNETSVPFGTQYDYFFATLEDYYIAKQDGIARIEAELSQWDNEAKKVIIDKLITIISESGISGFDANEIISLLNK